MDRELSKKYEVACVHEQVAKADYECLFYRKKKQ